MKRIREVRNLREEILDLLKRAPVPVQLIDLSKQLHIRSDSDEYEDLRIVLTKMSEEGQIQRHSRRRYALKSQNASGLTGIITLYHDNATVETDDKEHPIVHIKRQHLQTALDGDTVLVQLHAARDGKRLRGEVIAVLERTAHPISGTIENDGSFHYLIPDDAKYYVDFLVSEKNLHGAKPGDKVIAVFLRWEHANASPEAGVREVLGQSGKASVEFDAIKKEFGLPLKFPDAVEAEAAACEPPPAKVPKGRLDLRKELIITIDPDDAKDFDDALSLKTLKNGNLELGVHIADVTHYVKEGSLIDEEAQKRGNSTYLVDGVVPMLPEHLSNGLCSLVPNQPRYAYTVFMEFNAAGERLSYQIVESIIESKRRFAYEEVQKIIEAGEGEQSELILALHKLGRKLYDARMIAGGIDFESQEVKFILDANKAIIGATVKTRTDATSLVEECMLAANRTVAEHLHTLKKEWKTKQLPPFIYRIHDDPEPERLGEAVAVIRALGYDVPSGKLTPMQLNAIIHQAHDRPEKPVINQLLLRSMAKAIYAEQNVGHYGLGFSDYAHFTSPIRRYPDLFVHRVLKEYAKGLPVQRRWSDLLAQASRLSDQTSLTERASVDAERASTKLAQTILAREHIGEDFEGIVSGITSFGVFVTIKSLMIEGLLHIRDLTDDYYYFDDKRYRLIGRRNHRVFQFGTIVQVRIVKANIEKRNIDIALAPVVATEEDKMERSKGREPQRSREREPQRSREREPQRSTEREPQRSTEPQRSEERPLSRTPRKGDPPVRTGTRAAKKSSAKKGPSQPAAKKPVKMGPPKTGKPKKGRG
ncbi:MAG: ribonuclease R [bacterium]|nr:ribonuclease R [bacterium]